MAVKIDRYEKVTLNVSAPQVGAAFYDDEYDLPVGLRVMCQREGDLWRDAHMDVEQFRALRKLINEFGDELDKVVPTTEVK
jgi:hypothetical protein